MAELKTQKNDASVDDFLDAVEHDGRREDAKRLKVLFEEETGADAVMWGDAIVGFGEYDYEYASGRTGTWMRVGFSPRKQNLSLYLMDGFYEPNPLLDRLGPHKTGRSCLYITRLDRVDEAVLREMIRRSWESDAMGETQR